jgi:hypothetical protein
VIDIKYLTLGVWLKMVSTIGMIRDAGGSSMEEYKVYHRLCGVWQYVGAYKKLGWAKRAARRSVWEYRQDSAVLKDGVVVWQYSECRRK